MLSHRHVLVEPQGTETLSLQHHSLKKVGPVGHGSGGKPQSSPSQPVVQLCEISLPAVPVGPDRQIRPEGGRKRNCSLRRWCRHCAEKARKTPTILWFTDVHSFLMFSMEICCKLAVNQRINHFHSMGCGDLTDPQGEPWDLGPPPLKEFLQHRLTIEIIWNHH